MDQVLSRRQDGPQARSPVPDYLVDDAASYLAAGAPEGRIWSCSSGLRQALPENLEIRSPEALVKSTQVHQIGRALTAFKDQAKEILAAQETANASFAHLSATHVAQLHSIFLSSATKGLILSTWLAELDAEDAVVIGSPRISPVADMSCQFGLYDHLFAVLATAMAGDPPEGHRTAPLVIETPMIDGARFYEEFERVPAFDRVFNIANRTPSAIAYRFWRGFGAPALGRGTKGTILLHSDNEGIEECFVPLLRSGWRIVSVGIDVPAAEPSPLPEQLEKHLFDAWMSLVSGLLSTAVANACWKVAWSRIGEALALHQNRLGQVRELAKHWKRHYGGNGRQLVAFGNGLYRPASRLLDKCLREVGIPVICTDHGTSLGLVAWHDETADLSISFSDCYLAYNDAAQRSYAEARAWPDQQVVSVGTPKVIARSRFPRLQRAAARKRLGVGAREPTLMYVSSLAFNNTQPGFRTGTDHNYTCFQEQLIDCLRAFPGRVVIKAYPAHRYVEPDQIWSMELPDNFSVAPFGEFRHVRWAADVIVLDLSSSTIAWAAATDQPLILVSNCQNPYRRDAAEALDKAVFYVDALGDDWQDRLTELIGRPLDRIRGDWAARSIERAAVLKDYVLGERGEFVQGVTRTLDSLAVPNERPQPLKLV